MSRQLAEFVTLTCPLCGAGLQKTGEPDRFACTHCGREHLVRQAAGVVWPGSVVRGVDRLHSGAERAASELAIRRLAREIHTLEGRRNRICRADIPRQWPLWAGLLAGLSLLILAAFSFVQSNGMGWPALALSLTAPAGGVAHNYRLARARKTRHLRAVERQLVDRWRQMRTHQRIVAA